MTFSKYILVRGYRRNRTHMIVKDGVAVEPKIKKGFLYFDLEDDDGVVREIPWLNLTEYFPEETHYFCKPEDYYIIPSEVG